MIRQFLSRLFNERNEFRTFIPLSVVWVASNLSQGGGNYAPQLRLSTRQAGPDRTEE